MDRDLCFYAWHIEPTRLEDGSDVFDVVGASDEVRVVFNCATEGLPRSSCNPCFMGRSLGATAETIS